MIKSFDLFNKMWTGYTVSPLARNSTHVHAKSLQSCLALCDPMDFISSSSSVHAILQARILEWVAISSSGDLPNPRIELKCLYVSCTGRQVIYTSTTGKPNKQYRACQNSFILLIMIMEIIKIMICILIILGSGLIVMWRVLQSLAHIGHAA